jgi:hypothetical protein
MSRASWEPVIYQENKTAVHRSLLKGIIDYGDFTGWSSADRFFAFLLGSGFLARASENYPSPRSKQEVPVWFLLCAIIQMKLHRTASFHRLPGILRNGAVMARVGMNMGGFNRKNRTERMAAVDQDTTRKFFKSTDQARMRQWYNRDLCGSFRRHRAIDKHGIFVIDQSHVVVPRNQNYQGATWMLVDEHGHRIDTTGMSEEQKALLKPRLCYSLSVLLHVAKQDSCFIVSGYQWGPGTEDELVQARKLVDDFTGSVGTGVMKLAIVDRGYIDGEFISELKTQKHCDVLIPLRKDMDMYTSAVKFVESKCFRGRWELYRKGVKRGEEFVEEVVSIEQPGIWQECSVQLHVTLLRRSTAEGVEYWALASTFKPRGAKEAFELYAMRTQVEERYRQLKHTWNIGAFTSPDPSLVEAHVLFTLLTYSLLQLYLNKKHMTELANRTIDTIIAEQRNGKDACIVYRNNAFAVYDFDEYNGILMDFNPQARKNLKNGIQQRKRLKAQQQEEVKSCHRRPNRQRGKHPNSG